MVESLSDINFRIFGLGNKSSLDGGIDLLISIIDNTSFWVDFSSFQSADGLLFEVSSGAKHEKYTWFDFPGSNVSDLGL